MKNRLFGWLANAVAVTLVLGGAAVSAQASSLPSFESRISVVFTKTETGTGPSRTVVYSAAVTDSQGQLTQNSSPTGAQLYLPGLAIGQCPTTPVSRVAGDNNQGCTFYLWNSVVTFSSSGATLTASRTMTGQDLTNFEANLSSLPIVVPSVRLTDSSGAQMRVFDSSLSAPAAQALVAPDQDPGVAFSGPIIARLERSFVDGTGSITIHGKRLSTLTSVTIGGIAVELTTNKTGRSAVVVFSELPSGSHDLVITAKGGKTTIRGAVKVN